MTFYESHGFDGYVPVVVTVSTAAGSASGFDPQYPTYKPED